MTFFARPNLDDTQFKQLSGSTLTLDGRIIINSYSGLTLTGELGQIPVVISGETDGYVMTYKSGKIVLAETTASIGGTTIYNGASPTTCSVGGLASNTNIAGCEVTEILEMILAPTLAPTCTPPYATLTLTPNNSIFEVGCNIAFTANATYNQGTVSPVYCDGPSTRTGLPISYNYTDTYGVVCKIYSTSLSNITTFESHPILKGTNSVFLNVSYSSGEYPKKSDGSTDGMTCCSSGTTPSVQVNVIGILPYFWGSSTSVPTINQALINDACAAGNVCIAPSNSDVIVTNYNVTGEYIWLAIPGTSTTKTKWQGANSPSNCGTIPGDLFESEVMYTIDSPSSCWVGENYKFYVSKYPTSINYGMTFKNS